jgi:hypothetical protein
MGAQPQQVSGKTQTQANPQMGGKIHAQSGQNSGGASASTGAPDLLSLLGPMLQSGIGTMLSMGQQQGQQPMQTGQQNMGSQVGGPVAMHTNPIARQLMNNYGGQPQVSAPPPQMSTQFPTFQPFQQGFPAQSPVAQAYQGPSSAQQNPNQGGAATTPSSFTQPGIIGGAGDTSRQDR